MNIKPETLAKKLNVAYFRLKENPATTPQELADIHNMRERVLLFGRGLDVCPWSVIVEEAMRLIAKAEAR